MDMSHALASTELPLLRLIDAVKTLQDAALRLGARNHRSKASHQELPVTIKAKAEIGILALEEESG
jgi:hypothetical protein